jgi:UDP-N-acetylmuramoylalanine--D-glutamate ligase
VVLIGRDGPQIGAVLKDTDIPLLDATSLEDAVQKAFNAAQSGDAVLLSPACASFDMFRNYVHRAEVFVSTVNALKSGVKAAAS